MSFNVLDKQKVYFAMSVPAGVMSKGQKFEPDMFENAERKAVEKTVFLGILDGATLHQSDLLNVALILTSSIRMTLRPSC